MEGVLQDPSQLQNHQQQQPPPNTVAERLNPALQQQLYLESIKTRAISLFKAISRILEDFDAYARANSTPKWFSFFFTLLHALNFSILIYSVPIVSSFDGSQLKFQQMRKINFCIIFFFIFK